jgi:hypothetical protein
MFISPSLLWSLILAKKAQDGFVRVLTFHKEHPNKDDPPTITRLQTVEESTRRLGLLTIDHCAQNEEVKLCL